MCATRKSLSLSSGLPLVVGLSMAVALLASCSSAENPTASDAAAAGEEFGHIHSLDVNPADDTLYVASHHGVFALGADGFERVGEERLADTFVYSAPLAPVARAALGGDGVRVRSRLVVGGEPEQGELRYDQVLGSGESRPIDADVDRRDLSCLMYTSGTTGRPKGAMLTHDNHLWNVVNSLSFGRGLREGDVTVTVAPMFHIGGLGIHTLPLLYAGGTNVLLPAFDPVQTLDAMSRERATVQFMVPAMWAALMLVPGFDDFDLSSLELAVSGGAPCPLPVIDFYQGKGLPFQEGFGMTETAPIVSVLDADHVKEKAGSIGRAVFHVEARIADEADKDARVDEVGELVLRGPNVFTGYWGTVPRGVVGFEVILGAYMSLLSMAATGSVSLVL